MKGVCSRREKLEVGKATLMWKSNKKNYMQRKSYIFSCFLTLTI